MSILTIVLLFCLTYYGCGMPRAFVHIGPPKTASTFIQTFLAGTASDVQESNVIWPTVNHGRKKVFFDVARILTKFDTDSVNKTFSDAIYMKEFLDKNRALNRSVLISSEIFSEASIAGVTFLQSMLHGFDVTVVYVYRDFLSHLLSYHYEISRLDYTESFPFQPLPMYLMKNLDTLTVQIDQWSVLRRYEDTFGKESTLVIDLIGCEAAQVNVVYVLVCEIAGALCSDKALFNNSSRVKHNARKSLISREIFGYYGRFLEIYGASISDKSIRNSNHSDDIESYVSCHVCYKAKGNLVEQFENFEKYLHQQRKGQALPDVPLIRTHLSMLVPYAEEMDRKLREVYGGRILHGNASANVLAINNKVFAEFVDGDALMNSTEWREWMITTYQKDLNHGRLCGCNPK